MLLSRRGAPFLVSSLVVALPALSLTAAEPKVNFAAEVQPIFAESCVKCHGAPDPKEPKKGPGGGLRLDDKTAFAKGGKSGKAVVAGKSKDSLLYKLLQGPAKAGGREISRMPKSPPGAEATSLDPDKIALIRKWIDQGANWEEKAVDFATDVQPILADSCVRCHNAADAKGKSKAPAGGLRLNDKAALLKGGKSGKAVVPGKAQDSLLYKLLKGPAKVGGREIAAMPKRMGPGESQPLAPEKIDLIKKWIDQGAR